LTKGKSNWKKFCNEKLLKMSDWFVPDLKNKRIFELKEENTRINSEVVERTLQYVRQIINQAIKQA